jgi:hypothetical protein
VVVRSLVGTLALLLAGGLSASAQQTKGKKGKEKEEKLPLNEAVVAFCKANLGKQVGEGECAHLAGAAFKEAGAKPHREFPDKPNEGDYVWGELVFGMEFKNGKGSIEGSPTKIRPGDVVQYRDAKFAGRRPTGGTYSSSAAHHTAVVSGVSPDGKVITILQQNTNGKRFVTEDVQVLTDMQAGWMKVYRPVAK